MVGGEAGHGTVDRCGGTAGIDRVGQVIMVIPLPPDLQSGTSDQFGASW